MPIPLQYLESWSDLILEAVPHATYEEVFDVAQHFFDCEVWIWPFLAVWPLQDVVWLEDNTLLIVACSTWWYVNYALEVDRPAMKNLWAGSSAPAPDSSSDEWSGAGEDEEGGESEPPVSGGEDPCSDAPAAKRFRSGHIGADHDCDDSQRCFRALVGTAR